MKNTIISIILFLSVFSFVTYSHYRLDNLCNLIEKSCSEIEELINSNSLEAASVITNELLDNIKDNHLLSSMYLNHNDFDILSCEALKLSLYVECRNNDDSRISLNLLKCYAENIKKLHKLTVENIF
jgi:hypothetical protein